MSLLTHSWFASVDPAVAGFPASSRQASIRTYAGILAGAPVTGGQPTIARWRPVIWLALNRPLFGRGT